MDGLLGTLAQTLLKPPGDLCGSMIVGRNGGVIRLAYLETMSFILTLPY